MKTSYFAIYDKKANTFGQLFPSHTHGTAERSFKESINNPDSPHGRYPDDFALYHILDLDDDIGQVIETFEPPQLVVQAIQLTSPQQA